MKVGTKSLLFGVHQVILHPICVLIAWKRLYGWPRWWELICILVHDWGYWGCGDMDGPEGTNHPERGAVIAECIMISISRFVWRRQFKNTHGPVKTIIPTSLREDAGHLCAGHSRHYAKLHNFETSRLMPADKLGAVMLPWWIYIPMARATGEIAEYHRLDTREAGKPERMTDREWYIWLQGYIPKMLSHQRFMEKPVSHAD